MKSLSFLSSPTHRGWLRRTAVWLLGMLILAMGLSGCGSQADPNPSAAPPAATPVLNTNPETAPVEVNESPSAPAATQVTTGFNISGWV